jgi:hypothetical protein
MRSPGVTVWMPFFLGSDRLEAVLLGRDLSEDGLERRGLPLEVILDRVFETVTAEIVLVFQPALDLRVAEHSGFGEINTGVGEHVAVEHDVRAVKVHLRVLQHRVLEDGKERGWKGPTSDAVRDGPDENDISELVDAGCLGVDAETSTLLVALQEVWNESSGFGLILDELSCGD